MNNTQERRKPEKLNPSAIANGDLSGVREVTRHISTAIQNELWGRAAGRCEFAGCNKPLWKSSVTSERVNIGQKAHIYSFSEVGPRGRLGVSPEDVNSVDNLLLVCHECHQKVDKAVDGVRYSAPLLREMKRDHESRIELVTGIDASRKSHILLYGANIGEHTSPLTYDGAASAMFPYRYPATDRAISLSLHNSAGTDRDDQFWISERENLEKQFARRVRDQIADGEIAHLSVFSLAPQPLIIRLGTLLGDIIPCDVYQLHREPQTWAWPSEGAAPEYFVQEPNTKGREAALVLSLSATVDLGRITLALGEDVSIWVITVQRPHNDLMKNRHQLSSLGTTLRRVFDRIKFVQGQSAILHIFPAAPVSACLEIGRVRMPKADMPWQLYDQVNARGGFVPALSIALEAN
jgi:hypothetical protein